MLPGCRRNGACTDRRSAANPPRRSADARRPCRTTRARPRTATGPARHPRRAHRPHRGRASAATVRAAIGRRHPPAAGIAACVSVRAAPTSLRRRRAARRGWHGSGAVRGAGSRRHPSVARRSPPASPRRRCVPRAAMRPRRCARCGDTAPAPQRGLDRSTTRRERPAHRRPRRRSAPPPRPRPRPRRPRRPRRRP